MTNSLIFEGLDTLSVKLSEITLLYITYMKKDFIVNYKFILFGYGKREKSERMADNRKVIASSNACRREFLVPKGKIYLPNVLLVPSKFK